MSGRGELLLTWDALQLDSVFLGPRTGGWNNRQEDESSTFEVRPGLIYVSILHGLYGPRSVKIPSDS